MHLFVVFAPSGTGKTSLVQALAADASHLSLSVSHTTRPIREGEQNGVDYVFVNEDEFAALRKAGEFVEHAQVYGNWYGTTRRQLEKQLAQGHVLLEIDWQGARQIRDRMPGAVLIGIQPPNVAEVRSRLERRGKDSAETIDKRMLTIAEEIRQLSMADYLVVNDQFDQALADLRAIVRARCLEYATMRRQYQQLLASLDQPFGR